MISKDYDASYTAATSYREAGLADLTRRLKDPQGSVLASSGSQSGSASITPLTSQGGNHTLEVENHSTDFDVPSYQLGFTLASTMSLSLKDSQGTMIETQDSLARPKEISRTLAAGAYTISALPTGGRGAATVNATCPSHPRTLAIAYDANDHATEIDDGTTKTKETLSPSGRVLRRVLTDFATLEVTEDVIYGYEGDGDSPSYTRPSAGGQVTTYVNGTNWT